MRPIVVDLLAHIMPYNVAATIAPGWFTMVGLAGVVALFWMMRIARRNGIDPGVVASAVLWCYVAAVAAGIAMPMLIDAVEQKATTGAIHLRWAGMTSFWGYLAGTGAVIVVCRDHGVRLGRFADLCVAPLGVALALARTGCFLAGCDYGKVSALPWAVRFPAGSPAWHDQVAAGLLPASRVASLPVHPTELYELLLGLVICAFGVIGLRRVRREGNLFLGAVAIYAVGRIGIEVLRGDIGRGIYGGLSSGQIFSLLVLVALAARTLVQRVRVGRIAMAAATLVIVIAGARIADAQPNGAGSGADAAKKDPKDTTKKDTTKKDTTTKGATRKDTKAQPTQQQQPAPPQQPQPQQPPAPTPPQGYPQQQPYPQGGYPQQPYPQQPYPQQAPQPGQQPYPYPAQPGQQPYPAQPGQQPYPTQPGQPYPAQPGQQPYPYPAQPGQQPYPYPAQPGQQPYPYPAQPGQQPYPYPAQPYPQGGYPQQPYPPPHGQQTAAAKTAQPEEHHRPGRFAVGVLGGGAIPLNRRNEQVPALAGVTLSAGIVFPVAGIWLDFDSYGNSDASHGTLLASGSFAREAGGGVILGARAGFGATLVNFKDPVFRDATGTDFRVEATAEYPLGASFVLWARPLSFDVLTASSLGGPIMTWQFRVGIGYQTAKHDKPRASAAQARNP